MTRTRWTWTIGAMLLCTAIAPLRGLVADAHGQQINPGKADPRGDRYLERAALKDLIDQSESRDAEKDGRACNDCLTPNTDLGVIGNVEWGYSISGDCGTGGKWYASFTAVSGATYHFDVCSLAPGAGTGDFDADIKITDSSCTILAGVDGNSGCGWRPNNFTWSAPSAGTYYVVIAPYNSSTSHTCGGSVSNTFTMEYYAEAPSLYCSASGGCDEYISNVAVGTINNSTACTNYGNYTAQSTDMQIGSSYPITVDNGNGYGSDQCLVWADWNQDGDFTDLGEAFAMGGSPGVGPYTGSITPPVSALLGPTRMRVRINYNAAPPPCGTTTYGEVEDYTVNVLEAPPEGACCLNDVCTDGVTESECDDLFGVYHGDGSDCDPNPCIGACCDPSTGNCEGNLSEDDCLAISGATWTQFEDCVNGPYVCPSPGDDCGNGVPVTLPADLAPTYHDDNYTCGRGNSYEDATDTATCMGFYTSGEDLFYELTVTERVCIDAFLDTDTDYSGISIDSACPPSDECNGVSTSFNEDELIEDVLLEPGAYSIMIDTWSTPFCINSLGLTLSPCETGGCCSNGVCHVLSEPECALTGGAYQGDGSDCSGDPCGLGACCIDGGCEALTSTDCGLAGGAYQGDGVLCSTVVCNDDCGDALVTTDGVPAAEGDNCSATSDGFASCQLNSDKDVWFEYTAECTGTVTVSTEGSGQGDTVLAVYDACGGVEVECDDDDGTGLLSLLTFDTLQGSTYVIRVASYGTGCGDYDLNITCEAADQGACCNAGGCSIDYQLVCEASGGSYGGDGTACSGEDCNLNSIDDTCDFIAGTSSDCNNNGVPDDCDLSGGTSDDCQPDGVPDECQLNNDLAEDFEGALPGWTQLVLGYSGWFQAGPGHTGALALVHDWSDGFFGFPVDQETYLLSPEIDFPGTLSLWSVGCFDQSWCANYSVDVYIVTAAVPGGPSDVFVKNINEDWVDYLTTWVNTVVDLSPYVPAGGAPYRVAISYVGYDGDYAVIDDLLIADYNDCNTNGIPDDCEIAGGSAEDCDNNGLLDECEFTDCDNNTIHDACDILQGAADCQPDGILDKCQTDDNDCDGNGVPDDCDLANDPDCNNNGILDECDIDEGSSDDCQPDGIPDDCQLGGGTLSLFDEDFEGGTFPPAGWSMVQLETDPWVVTTNPDFVYTGARGLFHYWGDPPDTEDTYLLTPVIAISGAEITFHHQGCASGTQTWCDNYDYDVVIVTAPSPGDPSDVLALNLNPLWTGYYDQWIETTLDLSPYTPPFRVAFRYHGSDGDAGVLDRVTAVAELPGINDCNENGVPDECDNCADLDGDLDVDNTDYQLFRATYGRADGDPAYNICADYDESGAVGLTDYQTWLACYRDYINNPLAAPPTTGGGVGGSAAPTKGGLHPLGGQHAQPTTRP